MRAQEQLAIHVPAILPYRREIHSKRTSKPEPAQIAVSALQTAASFADAALNAHVAEMHVQIHAQVQLVEMLIAPTLAIAVIVIARKPLVC